MDVFSFHERLIRDYADYVSSFHRVRDEDLRSTVDNAIEGGHPWPDPLVQLNPAFEAGGTVNDRVLDERKLVNGTRRVLSHRRKYLPQPAAEAERLVEARPDANIAPQQAETFARRVVEGFEALRPHLNRTAQELAEELLDAHRRVREAAKRTHVKHRVEPRLPPDVLGLYVYLPATGV